MCEWCGHEHDQAALCTDRPTWGRRGFLALFGAGIAGLAVTGVTGLPWPDPIQEHVDRRLTEISLSFMNRLPSYSQLWLAT